MEYVILFISSSMDLILISFIFQQIKIQRNNREIQDNFRKTHRLLSDRIDLLNEYSLRNNNIIKELIKTMQDNIE